MIPTGVQAFVALEPIDMRCYAEAAATQRAPVSSLV